MIDIEQMKRDREAGSPGPWRLGSWGDNVFGTGANDEWISVCRVKRDDAQIEESQDAVDARRISRVPDMEDTILEQQAEIERLKAALREIADITERKKNCYPPDWREQIAACPECQRYKDHPIQRGICDDHRRPIYAQEEHDAHETKVLGYRAQDIARAALGDSQ